MARTNPSISERSSMIGIVWISVIHGIVLSARSRSPTGTKQDWRMIRDQHSPVQRGGFSSNELRAQVGQIADIFVLPTRSASSGPLRASACIGNALLPQRAHVNSRLVSHLKLSARKRSIRASPIEGDDTARKITPQTSKPFKRWTTRRRFVNDSNLRGSKTARLRLVSNFFLDRNPSFGIT